MGKLPYTPNPQSRLWLRLYRFLLKTLNLTKKSFAYLRKNTGTLTKALTIRIYNFAFSISFEITFLSLQFPLHAMLTTYWQWTRSSILFEKGRKNGSYLVDPCCLCWQMQIFVTQLMQEEVIDDHPGAHSLAPFAHRGSQLIQAANAQQKMWPFNGCRTMLIKKRTVMPLFLKSDWFI